jgi:hypothetical protein
MTATSAFAAAIRALVSGPNDPSNLALDLKGLTEDTYWPASNKQIWYLTRLLRGQGLDADWVVERLDGQPLTRWQASRLIDALKVSL